MGLPPYFLGLTMPLIGGIAIGIFLVKWLQQEQEEPHHRIYSRDSRPNWECHTKKKQNNSGDTCTICLETISDPENARPLKCGHKFHDTCLVDLYMNKINKCPQCRATVF